MLKTQLVNIENNILLNQNFSKFENKVWQLKWQLLQRGDWTAATEQVWKTISNPDVNGRDSIVDDVKRWKTNWLVKRETRSIRKETMPPFVKGVESGCKLIRVRPCWSGKVEWKAEQTVYTCVEKKVKKNKTELKNKHQDRCQPDKKKKISINKFPLKLETVDETASA